MQINRARADGAAARQAKLSPDRNAPASGPKARTLARIVLTSSYGASKISMFFAVTLCVSQFGRQNGRAQIFEQTALRN
jgi:hypothetical protein